MFARNFEEGLQHTRRGVIGTLMENIKTMVMICSVLHNIVFVSDGLASARVLETN